MEKLNQKPRVVILGAGFGGLRAAVLLSKKNSPKNCEIVLIDRNAYHTYAPTLYEAATTSKETANYLDLKQIVTLPIAELIKNSGVRFIQGEVKTLDLINGDARYAENNNADGEIIKFDYLVLAPGSETNYFDIPGLKENSLPLKTFMDALKIRDKVLDLIESGKNDIRIAIGGGGPTGVELAGELQEWLFELKIKNSKYNPRITIIDGAPSILPGFPEKIVKPVQKRLKKLDIEAVTSEIIKKASTDKITLESGRELRYDVLIWTGGVKAAPVMGALPLKLEKRGRVEVIGEMECLPQSPDLKLYGKIYGLGDAVCFYDPETGKPIAGVAQAAISQANVVAHNILEYIKKSSDPNYQLQIINYRPKDYPYVIPVGGKWAVARVGSLVISGFFGWVLKGLVELKYLLSIMPFWQSLKIWLKGLRIFIQNDRLG